MKKLNTCIKPYTTSTVDESIVRAQIRRKGKKTRFFIDNEFIEKGYLGKLPKHIFAVYSTLAKYAHSEKQKCFPSISTLSKEAGCNRNYVSKAIHVLEALRIISVQRKNNKVNHYTLLDTQVWLPVSSINADTYKVVSKKTEQEYQKQPQSSITPDTRNHIKKSDNEISNQFSIKNGGSLGDWQLRKARVVLGADFTDDAVIAVLNRAKKDGVPTYNICKEDVLRKYSTISELHSKE